MQRVLVIMAVVLVITGALGVGVLASHWPFWRRAWQWQVAADGWPENLPGPQQQLQAGAGAVPLQLEPAADLARLATETSASMLLVAGADGRGQAFFGAGYSAMTVVDGRGLTAGLLAPLYGVLAVRHPGLLDTPVSAHLPAWYDRRGGVITPRLLLWQLSGLPAQKFRPLNPLSARAQLAAGPDFGRATLGWKRSYPPGSHFEESPANAQLLALLAARLGKATYAQVLEADLWSGFAAREAVAMQDHPRGDVAAHCCMRAVAGDWLRLGLLLANDGRVGGRQLLPAGFVAEMAGESAVHTGYGLGYKLVATQGQGSLLQLETRGRLLLVSPATGRALFWMGEGAPPEMQQLAAILNQVRADNRTAE